MWSHLVRCIWLFIFYCPKQISCWYLQGSVFAPLPYHLYRRTLTIHRTYFPMNFSSWFVLGSRKMNNCAHLVRRNYMQEQLHFQYCFLYVFVKWLLRNFHSIAGNSKIISPCNFMLIASQNAEGKNMETYFWDDPRYNFHLNSSVLNYYFSGRTLHFQNILQWR